MIHKFKMHGTFIVTDVNSGAVHVMDETAYENLEYYKESDKASIVDMLSSKYGRDKVDEAYDEICDLENGGQLYAGDPFSGCEPVSEPEPVIKALC
ncbi:MAG: thioether cross-link-forming SCIFF peptide maturase, partial [Ruminiclostridium sp.]|nr:thioether cross-link-forming SCIFF peptide maturase [Ruminiclostridium sp.]